MKQVAILVRGNDLGMSQTCLTMKTLVAMMIVMTPSNFLKRAMPLLRQRLRLDWMTLPGLRKRRSLGFPTVSG